MTPPPQPAAVGPSHPSDSQNQHSALGARYHGDRAPRQTRPKPHPRLGAVFSREQAARPEALPTPEVLPGTAGPCDLVPFAAPRGALPDWPWTVRGRHLPWVRSGILRTPWPQPHNPTGTVPGLSPRPRPWAWNPLVLTLYPD